MELAYGHFRLGSNNYDVILAIVIIWCRCRVPTCNMGTLPCELVRTVHVAEMKVVT